MEELIENKYLYQRLAIYDMLYFMEQFIKRPDIQELKEPIIEKAKFIS